MKNNFVFKCTLLFAIFANTLLANNNFSTPCEVAKEYLKALDDGITSEISNLLAENCLVSAPFLSQPIQKQGWLNIAQGLKVAYPDMQHQVKDCLESDRKVAVRGVVTGQNNGEFMGNPPSGNRIEFTFNAMFELDNSQKIKAIYVQFDQKTMESQLMAGLPDPIAVVEANVRGILSAADAGNTVQLLSFFTSDAQHHFSGQLNTNEELSKRVSAFKAGFPDVKRDIKILSSSKDEVTVQGWLSGTNLGTFMGNPASGNAIKVSVLGMYKFNAAGKVTEAWIEMDTATLLKQINGSMAAKGN